MRREQIIRDHERDSKHKLYQKQREREQRDPKKVERKMQQLQRQLDLKLEKKLTHYDNNKDEIEKKEEEKKQQDFIKKQKKNKEYQERAFEREKNKQPTDPKKKKKKFSKTSLQISYKETEKLFSQSIRLTGATKTTIDKIETVINQCYTCHSTIVVCQFDPYDQERKRTGEMHNGHMIAQGRGRGIKFERNVCRPQCMSCNMFHGEKQDKRTLKWKKEVGDKIHYEVLIKKRSICKLNQKDLDQIQKESQNIINKMIN